MAELDWTPVEEAAAANTIHGWQVALLEAAKLFEARLKEVNLPGRTVTEKFNAAKMHFTRPAEVTEAFKYVNGLRRGNTPALTKERAPQLLQAFKQGLADLSEIKSVERKPVHKIKSYLGLWQGRQRWVWETLAVVGGFLLLVLLLGDTEAGRDFSHGLVTVVNTLVSWLIGLVLILLAVAMVVGGTAIYLDRRGGGKVKTEEDGHEAPDSGGHGHH